MSPENSRTIAAVVFDWAGTLVDFGSCAPPGAFVVAFEQLGVGITMGQARAPMGMAKREHIAAILHDPPVAKDWHSAHGSHPDEEAIDSVYEAFLPLQMACIEEHSGVISGVAEAVERLVNRGIRIGSSTGYTRELMERVLPIAEAAGLSIEVVLTASDVEFGRPAPWLIFENARRLGVYPMNRLVKVDDTVAGIEAGRNAGAWCVGVSRTGNLVGLGESDFNALPEQEQRMLIDNAERSLIEAGAHLVIESASQIDSAIDAIERVIDSAGLHPDADFDQVQQALHCTA